MSTKRAFCKDCETNVKAEAAGTQHLRRLLALAVILASLTGCGLSPTYTRNRAANMSTEQLLRGFAAFSGQGALSFTNPGELLGMPYAQAIWAELERRGYNCNPTGCYIPR